MVAPSTQDTWRSKDYINDVRLVDMWIIVKIYEVGSRAIYIYIG